MPRRTLGLTLVGVFSIVYAVFIYFLINKPYLPFIINDLNTIMLVQDQAAAGDLRAGDVLVTVNNQPEYGCFYLYNAPPFYTAPRGERFPVTYVRETSTGEIQQRTEIILNQALYRIEGRIINVVTSFLFFLAGLVTLASKSIDKEPNSGKMLAGLAFLLAGPMIIAITELSGNLGPGVFFYSLVFPIEVVLLLLAYSRWPGDLTKHPVIKGLLVVTVPASLFAIVVKLASSELFGCNYWPLDMYNAVGTTIIGLLALTNILVPLIISQRAIKPNPFKFAQLRALIWAFSIGLGSNIILGMIPDVLDFPWGLPAEMAFALMTIIPLTHIYLVRQNTLSRIEKFISVDLLKLVFILTWIATTMFFVWIVTILIPHPSPLLFVFASGVPALLFSTVLFNPFSEVVYRVIYGERYDYDKVVSTITDSISQCTAPDNIAGTLLSQLPVPIHIEYAALWLIYADTEQTRVYGHNVNTDALPQLPPGLPSQTETTSHSEDDNLIFFHELREIGGYEWHIFVKLISGTDVIGILLLSTKEGNLPYSQTDLKVIKTTTTWASHVLRIYHLTESQIRQEQEITDLIMAAEKQLREETAADLHDRVITNLAWVKRMVEAGREGEVIEASIQRVIMDTREMCYSNINPYYQQIGLTEQLESFVLSERQYAADSVIKVSLHPGNPAAWQQINADSDMSHALFYAIREAVINARKANPSATVMIEGSIDEDAYRIVVRDNGPGFDTSILESSGRQHRGLALLKARLRRIGGSAQIASAVGEGTIVTICGPVVPNGSKIQRLKEAQSAIPA